MLFFTYTKPIALGGCFKPHKAWGSSRWHARPRDGSGRLGTARDARGRVGAGGTERRPSVTYRLHQLSTIHGSFDQLIYTGSYNTTAAVRAESATSIARASMMHSLHRVSGGKQSKRTHLPSESEGFALAIGAALQWAKDESMRRTPLTEV